MPENASNGDGPALGYARPYEMQIARDSQDPSAIRANVRYVYGVGPVVKIELQAIDDGTLLEAELGRRQFDELDLKLGEIVFVSPRNYVSSQMIIPSNELHLGFH